MKKNGTETAFLVDRVTAFNVAEDNYLYYAQLNEDAGSVTISKMNIETLKSEELMEMETNGEEVSIFIIYRYLFFHTKISPST